MSKLIVPMIAIEGFKPGDRVQHPTFGEMEICGIFEVEPEKYELYCELLDFNKTMKAFDSEELKMLKSGKGKLKAVK